MIDTARLLAQDSRTRDRVLRDLRQLLKQERKNQADAHYNLVKHSPTTYEYGWNAATVYQIKRILGN